MDLNNSAKLVRSADFWFINETIVLRVEQTLFRVYPGCPVVHLHDAEVEFTRFIKALHASFPACPISGMSELSSVLRLSDKYGVKPFRNSMISILTTIYPSLLTAWSERDVPVGYKHTYFDDFIALDFARKMNTSSILPVVMYDIVAEGLDSMRRLVLRAQLWTLETSSDASSPPTNLCAFDRAFSDSSSITIMNVKTKGARKSDSAGCRIHAGAAFTPATLSYWSEVSGGATMICALWNDLPSIFDLPAWDVLLTPGVPE
ncbi:hypothetical protein C8J57DRAFT_1705499 [Mycena rebaudengoi]|nr:hypothetical protein C8J57DRAFT_1705499 [Mycena rebaudengoi]